MSARWGFIKWTKDMALSFKDRLLKRLAMVCDDYVVQLERASSTGMYHYQMYLKLKMKTRPRTLAKAWNDEFRGIEMSACSAAGRETLRTYAMKEETRVAGPWGMKPIYMGDDLITDLMPWQQRLLDYVNGPPHDREILWFADVKGRSGKTALGKYLAYHKKAVYMTWAPTKDVLHLCSTMPKNGLYIFNLSRTKPATFQSDDLYAALESIKDGSFMNVKYETKQVLMKPPHVIVFANCKPDRSKLTDDRFNIIELTEEHQAPKKAQPSFRL